MTFRGRVALVTGAASGMGQLATWRLAAGDAVVAALDIDTEGLARTARRAPNVHTFDCDVTDLGAVHDVVARVEADLGPVDRVVNAAAIAPAGRIVDQPVEVIEKVTMVTYLGLVRVTKAVLPGMLERGRGDLVQFASLAGWLPSQKLGAYSAAKAAVVSFCETLHHEHLDSGLRMVCVCPPVVDTPLLDKLGDDPPKGLTATKPIAPEEVLDAVELALDAGEFMVFPGRGTKSVWRARRLVPGAVWRRIDALEG